MFLLTIAITLSVQLKSWLFQNTHLSQLRKKWQGEGSLILKSLTYSGN